MADKVKNIRTLLTEEEVDRRIREVADEVNRYYGDDPIHIVCILKGGAYFACELSKHLKMPVSIGFMSVSSYGAGTTSSGIVRIIKDLDEPIEGKRVLIAEDIVDTGKTLAYLIEVFKGRKPKDIKVCALLNKPDRRTEKYVTPDFSCFSVPNEFVVGYGLDYDQMYRNLPYIGVVEFGKE